MYQMKNKHIIHLCIFFALILMIIPRDMDTAAAQSQTRWSPQDRIPFYDDLILEGPH